MKSVKTYQFSKGKKNLFQIKKKKKNEKNEKKNLFSIRKIIKNKKESKEESKNARER